METPCEKNEHTVHEALQMFNTVKKLINSLDSLIALFLYSSKKHVNMPTKSTRENKSVTELICFSAVRLLSSGRASKFAPCLRLKGQSRTVAIARACVCLDSRGLQPVIAPLSRVGRRYLSDP